MLSDVNKCEQTSCPHTTHKAQMIDAIKFFKATAITPDVVAEKALAGVGRLTIIDQGYYPLSVKAILKIVDLSFLTEIMVSLAHHMPDFKAVAKVK